MHGAWGASVCHAFCRPSARRCRRRHKRPDNFVEIGVSGVNEASGKFGEYNGLKLGRHLYRESSTSAAAMPMTALEHCVMNSAVPILARHHAKLAQRILANRDAGSSKFGYDELRHVISDTYQTPYLEKMGGNTFTLPAAFGYIDTTRNATLTPTGDGQVPGAAWVAGNRNMMAAQQGAFHTEEISSSRKNTSFGAGFTFNRQWSVSLDLNRLERSGAELLGVATQSYSLVSAPSATATPVTATWKNQGSI